MNLKTILSFVGVCLGFATFSPTFPAGAAQSKLATIVSPREASYMEQLAAREVRRYVYLRTGQLLPIITEPKGALPRGMLIVVARKDRPLVSNSHASLDALGPGCYRLMTLPNVSARATHTEIKLLTGGDDAGTLYAAYRFAEHLGIRFYLHGDVIPDEPMELQQLFGVLLSLDDRGSPLFALRGIQPFHDFPEGPDWWNRDDYLAVIGQLPKLRMNFFGLHTYPEERPNAEPTVWIGLPGEIGAGGKVKSSYPSSYMNTLRGNWGYAAEKTSDFLFGSAGLFERDDFGPEVMFGCMPSPTTPEACNALLDRTAGLLHDAFNFAHQVGVKTCAGTETALVVPRQLQERLKAQGKSPADPATVQALYEGIFRRAAQAYPLDYYWFWTPEGWTWSGVKDEEIKATLCDLNTAIAAHAKVQPPFRLATCGWVLGPQQDRAMFDKVLPKDVAVSCINREVGYTPVDAGFADVHGRGKWAIPWMEDDPALTSPQLWAGRMRRDAADALRYGCDGLMGIHWRTRVLGPNVSALAQAAWEQAPWAEAYTKGLPAPTQHRESGAMGGQVADFPNTPIADTQDAPLYQTVRYNLSGYHLPATNGTCSVTLKFCEPAHSAAGVRVFDVKLQGQPVLESLDIFARVGKNRALDFTFTNIIVTNGWLDIGFVPRVEYPSIAAVVVEGAGFTEKINCGGPAYKDYAADLPAPAAPTITPPSTKDFYADWALSQFGPEAGAEAAAIFVKIDGALPKPCSWADGPGNLIADKRPWAEVKPAYAFVDEFAALAPRVKSAGNRERYDYWLNSFRYLRAMAETACAWGEYNQAMEKVKALKDAAEQKALARQLALPLRVKLIGLVGVAFDHALATVSTPGELGTIANLNQHNLPGLLKQPGEELAKILGEPLPANAQPGKGYHGPMRIIVPTKRTSLAANETLTLKVIILSGAAPRTATLNWRKLGARRFTKLPLKPVARGVYSVQLPAGVKDDFEYYIQADPERGQPVYFPATAPKLNQTVVVTAPVT